MKTVLLTPNITFDSMSEALSYVQKTNITVDTVKKPKMGTTDIIMLSTAVIGVSILCYGLYVHLNEKKLINNTKKR